MQTDGPYRKDLDGGEWVIKRDHPIVSDREGEVVIRNGIDLDEAVELANDAFRLGRTAADPRRFFHESLLQGDPNSVS
jgi:hypothetical protein